MEEVEVRQFILKDSIQVNKNFSAIEYLRDKDIIFDTVLRQLKKQLKDSGYIFHNYYILNDKITDNLIEGDFDSLWNITRIIEYACFKPNLNYDALPLNNLNFIVDSVKNYSGIKHNIIEIQFLPPFDRSFYNSEPNKNELIEHKKIVAKRQVFRLNDTEFFKYIILNPFE